ncbi:P-loop containing nucleoside triphosphate hydrolase protein [Ochromonadaceae sp. CCMP2298]|nr:P-loop containing nucleoside triphosphate hydrolase protein [Ochromonadaceae sp. CCMP2298]|mmetsp:Transcript_21994/g.47626  ORF Transcript_21994/g.47626 Transcript_21994/m.47626 type:complete len:879 (+) Transcript_21994:174-2810(+)
MSKKQNESNIQTFLRVRPSKSPSGYFKQDDMEKGSMKFNLPSNFKADYINNSKLNHAFHFDGVIDAAASQDDVFKTVGMAAVQNALDGFNSTIFAYGQTGSGKTFTLTGGPEKYSDRGIIPRAISMLFNECRTRTDIQLKTYISYLELYNEQGYDLLDPSHETKSLEDLPKVSILEDEHGNFHLKNLSMHPAEAEEDALNLLFLGDTNRAIAETPMNMASSRSHCIFTLSIEAREVGSDKVRRSKLHLVDLAGSERVAKTNSSGSVLNEAKYINTSLFFLEMVIVALYEKATKGRLHVPYRNSMMTSVLRDSLGGNCKTIMIATINPESGHTDESLSTCKFAQRVSLIKNRALLNEETDPSVMIRRLKGELLNLREEISFLKGESGEGELLSPAQLEELKQLCRTYCFDHDPNSVLNVGALTLTKIKDVFVIMKNLVMECKAAQGSSSMDPGMKQITGGTEDSGVVVKQVQDLKSQLLQRDSEIAILVNMVKKGKSADDFGGVRSSRENESVSSDVRRSHPSSGNMAHSQSAQNTNAQSNQNSQDIQQATSKRAPQLSYQEQQAAAQMQRERDNQERIVKRHLFGVAPPTDREIFDDAGQSFRWFSERCGLNASMQENKDLLRDKIAEAKTMGERANQSRGTINYLKNSIEAIRRERALSRLSQEDKGEEESEEEVTYRRAIDQEKSVYKESFDKLRLLKPEIEHVRKMVEKCRGNMQTQFDQWYSNLHARNGAIAAQSTHGSSYQGEGDTLNQTATYERSVNSSFTDPRGHGQGGQGYGQGQGYRGQELSAQSQGKRDPQQYQQQQRVPALNLDAKLAEADRRESTGQMGQGSVGQAGGFPGGSLVNNKDSESDVNEDILAFYQAKEELLKRRGAAR